MISYNMVDIEVDDIDKEISGLRSRVRGRFVKSALLEKCESFRAINDGSIRSAKILQFIAEEVVPNVGSSNSSLDNRIELTDVVLSHFLGMELEDDEWFDRPDSDLFNVLCGIASKINPDYRYRLMQIAGTLELMFVCAPVEGNEVTAEYLKRAPKHIVVMLTKLGNDKNIYPSFKNKGDRTVLNISAYDDLLESVEKFSISISDEYGEYD